jgi:hypothetical protein
MKKLLLATLVTAASFSATAYDSVLTFDDSSFNATPGSEVVFDFIDFDSDIADVTQTDTDGNGNITGVEDFSEVGSTDLVNFKLGTDLLGNGGSAYEVFYNYTFSGMATSNGVTIEVDFDAGAGSSGLYVDTTVNGTFDGGTQIASYTLNDGTCTIIIGATAGFCLIDLDVDFTAGYFYNTNGDDVTTLPGKQSSQLIVTVQDIIGLDFFYSAPGASQEFQILHDGNMTFDVPEPASVAILGLGLLGFAGARRRKA